MGSLSSRPSAPAPSQVVFVPQSVQTPVSTPSTTTTTSTTDSGSDSGSVDPVQTPSEARTSSLLQRSRGRFGTVQTSFRGLLGLADSSGQRKSLLGE